MSNELNDGPGRDTIRKMARAALAVSVTGTGEVAEALHSCVCLLEVMAINAKERGDNVECEMMSVMAENGRAALAVSVPGKAEGEESETGETARELEFERDIMADALRQIADATGTYVSIAIFAVNTAKQVLSCAAPTGEQP